MPARPGRPRSAEGRRNNVCTKLSDAEFEAVKAACGDMERSEWARLALLAAAERQRPPVARRRGGAESTSDIMAAIRRRKNGDK